MRIASIGFARNEAEILESFVRHHCTLFDAMFLVLHRCSDNTKEILDLLIAEGKPIHYVDGEYNDGDVDGMIPIGPGITLHKSSGVLTDLMRQIVAEHGFDWVFALDVDEFVSIESRHALEAMLGSVDPTLPVALPSASYVPTPEDDSDEPHLLKRIVFRRDLDRSAVGNKVAIPRSLAIRDDLIVASGNHCVVDLTTKAFEFGREIQGLTLAHFPVRDEWQLRNRMISAYLMLRASPVRHHGGFFSPRKLWARCVDLRPIDDAELHAIAMNYGNPHDREPGTPTRDPVAVLDGTLRYPARRVETWDLLVESALHLADRLGLYADERLSALLAQRAPGERL